MNLRVVPFLVIVLSLNSAAQVERKPSASPAKRLESETNIYRNPTFGFRYRIPYGWVDRTKEMQEGNDASKGEVLLAIFERPPQATGDTINSAIVIATERATTYPGLKTAGDYLAPLTEITTSKGFKPDGDPSEVEVASQRTVRADFSKVMNDKLVMHQATLVLLNQGQIVSFTFIADSLDAVNDLIDGLSFSSPRPKVK
jgi:hypothetical protein